MTLVDWIELALLGGVGAVLRYAVDDWVEATLGGDRTDADAPALVAAAVDALLGIAL